MKTKGIWKQNVRQIKKLPIVRSKYSAGCNWYCALNEESTHGVIWYPHLSSLYIFKVTINLQSEHVWNWLEHYLHEEHLRRKRFPDFRCIFLYLSAVNDFLLSCCQVRIEGTEGAISTLVLTITSPFICKVQFFLHWIEMLHSMTKYFT